MDDVNTKYQDIDLPGEWIWCSLGEIAAAQPGFACGNKNVQDGLIHLRMNNISDDCSLNMDLIRKVPLDYKIEKYLLKPGDLLFCHTNSSKLVGKNAIFNLNGDYAYSNHLTRLRVDPSIISTKWLWCILTVYWKEGRFENECKNWVNQSTLPHDKFVQLSIPIPPILEQHLIVTRVDSLMEHVRKAKESLEKIPRIMKRFRQAALKKVFSGELTAEWRAQQQDLEPAAELLKRIQEERKHHYEEEVRRVKAEGRKMPKMKFMETEPLDTSDQPDLPTGWVWHKLDNCIEILDSQRIPINSEEREKRISNKSKAELYPYYGATGQVGWIDDYLFDEELVLLGEDGAPFLEPIKDKAYIIKGKSWVNNHAHVLKAISEISSNSFLCHYLNIFDYHGYVSGTTRLKLNQGTMKQIPIPIPPSPEQQEIVRRIESLFKFADETEKNAEKARKRVELMTQSILARAFRGDLTADFREAVKNWKGLEAEARRRYIFVLPEDEQEEVLNADEFPMEPASELLRRIGEERAKMERKSSKPRSRGQKQKLPPDSVVTNMN